MLERFEHQQRLLDETRTLREHAVFWEQGTGKTRFTLDTMMELAREDLVDSALVLAPNGVHRAWIEDEVPEWVGDVPGVTSVFYTSSKAGTKRHQAMLDAALSAPFCIVAMSYEAFMTKRGNAFAKKLFKKRRVFMVCDESTMIKTPGAKRTKSIVAAGKYATARRILTGTPVANSPFDVYTQVRFLDDGFWKRNGFKTYSEFKNYFGVWKTGYNSERGKEFQFVVSYRNLDRLQALLSQISSRVLKADVLDLPPKSFSKRYFDLTPEQWRVYREVRDEAMTFLSSGELITAPLAITRLIRFAQITSNYLPTEGPEDEPFKPIDSAKNPRLDCLAATVDEVANHQMIIWARFVRDIDQIVDMLGKSVVRYDGKVNDDDRALAKKRFQAGDAQYFVGNPQAASMGLTLHAAETCIYYNNTFRLLDRQQSEDRAHRAGLKHPVQYIDIVAPGTVDVKIVESLRGKVNIAAAITGDELREWI